MYRIRGVGTDNENGSGEQPVVILRPGCSIETSNAPFLVPVPCERHVRVAVRSTP